MDQGEKSSSASETEHSQINSVPSTSTKDVDPLSANDVKEIATEEDKKMQQAAKGLLMLKNEVAKNAEPQVCRLPVISINPCLTPSTTRTSATTTAPSLPQGHPLLPMMMSQPVFTSKVRVRARSPMQGSRHQPLEGNYTLHEICAQTILQEVVVDFTACVSEARLSHEIMAKCRIPLSQARWNIKNAMARLFPHSKRMHLHGTALYTNLRMTYERALDPRM
ncbi:Oidioi.mRNA.OKI2018_I69.chr1.g3806.t1.cds [Oikopleura dioica]|uniref:Oidioi.mRNA.OKI2018_I69.chr1.g3806.t1.cds n=1 Tax=Oikopleura dioica TaxID=34765 RepID=A0ABN7T1T4_OIKDI|nr:Oidioi.mRNA.OKI2018_I69.chr1.g3806.t1.cds [Oikopleura dioica]